MKPFLFCVFVIGMLCLLAAGCSEYPNMVGLGVLPPQDSLTIDSLKIFSTSDITFLSRVVGGSSTLLFGTYQALEARTLLSFAGFSTIPQTASLDSAKLTLRINYRFMDSSGIVGIEVRKFLHSFSGGKFTWDSTTTPGAYSDTISGTLLQTLSPQDSLLTVHLDTILVRQWMQTNIGSIILLPTGNTVVGFSPSATAVVDLRPEFTVAYHDTSDSARTSSFRLSSGIFVADGNILPQPGRMIVQAGIGHRGILRFDSLNVPQRASITQAMLEVAVDTTASLMNSYSDDNVVAFLLRKNVLPYDSLALGTKCTPAYNGAQKVYRANVKAIVQQWLLREPNNGLLIRASGELSTFDRFVLYGSSALAALRPKLTITYTVLP